MRNLSQIEYTVDMGYLGEFKVTVFYHYYPGQPGQYCGPPENCYPDELPEIEVLGCAHPVLSEAGAEVLLESLQNDEDLWHLIDKKEVEAADDADDYYTDLKEGGYYDNR